MVDRKTEAVCSIVAARRAGRLERALVVGCGSGREAVTLGRRLGVDVTGIDIVDRFDPEARLNARLLRGDATCLDFPDVSFDLVYCYHALEHIRDPMLAVMEMGRVLRDDGLCWVGTPNRLRLVGYLGSSSATWQQKMQWNLGDWKARARGKFTNEQGAHAGFSPSELRGLLSQAFAEVHSMRCSYYCELYRHYRGLVRLISRTGVGTVVFPSTY
jgi:ubiquinone/menaquinone biosynthesis C-methylase UbiE